MRPTHHALASGVVSSVFWAATRSWEGTLVCFASGIFIDVDHIFDFWLAKRKFWFRYQELWDFCTVERTGKLYLIFHSYELWIVFWLMLLTGPAGVLWWGLGVGVTTHMLLDAVVNPLRPLVYFFTYRFRVRFVKEQMFPDNYFEKVTCANGS